MFAVIKTGGKQYRVAADDVIEIERLSGEAGDMIEIGSVLMVGVGKDVTVGSPFVEGALVTAEVIEQNRGPKVISFKKRRRQNSKRIRGHRQLLSTVRISEILTGGARPSKKAAAKAAPAETASVTEATPAAAEASEAVEAKAAKPARSRAKAAKEEAPQAAPLFTAPEGDGDDLTRIKGIGPVAKRQLNEQGITTFAQIAALTDADVARIDENMPFSAEQISDWREQASKFAE